jgi:hypothetical protein
MKLHSIWHHQMAAVERSACVSTILQQQRTDMRNQRWRHPKKQNEVNIHCKSVAREGDFAELRKTGSASECYTCKVSNISQKHTSLLQNTISGLHVCTALSHHHQALQGTDQRLSKFIVHSGIPSAYNRWCNYCKCLGSQSALWTLITLDLFLGGPDDDSKQLKRVALK